MDLKRIFGTFAIVLFSSAALAVDSDCADKGGKQHCVAVSINSDWRYALCDDWAAFLSRTITWCNVRGGTWTEPGPGCYGATADTAGNGENRANLFEQLTHNACHIDHTSSGWGTAYSSYNCWSSAGPATVNGVEYSSLEVFAFNGMSPDANGNCNQAWTENVVFRRDRNVACPGGFATRNGTDGKKECTAMPPCPNCVGNPIDVGNAAKRLVETDYSAGAFGGITVVRYYNSLGFFDNQARAPNGSDYWRTNWTAKIVGYVDPQTQALNNAYVSSAAVRPDGSVRYFGRNTGADVQNVDGQPYHMDVLTTPQGQVNGWVLTTDQKDVETYSAGGALQSITTRNGLVYTLNYDTGGSLVSVTDPFGRTMLMSSGGFTDFNGGQYVYGYDDQGRLSSVTYPGGSIRSYVYEDTNWKFALTGIFDERGVRLGTYAYDSTGQAISTEHAGGVEKYTTSRTDFGTSSTTSVTDPYGTTRSFTFNKIGGINKLTSSAYWGLGTETRTYDANGKLASITDRRGYVTNYTMDPTRGLETSRTEAYNTPVARTTTTTWDPVFPLPAQISEPGGIVKNFTYDTAGNLTKAKITGGTRTREWNYTVDAHGRVLTVDGPRTDATDITTVVYYSDTDACTGCRGQPYTITNAAGHVTTFNAYDLNGRPTQVTDANGVVTTLTYKPRGWLATLTAGGEATTFDYDLAGNLQKATRPDGSWFQYSYDAANRLVGIDDSMGNAIDYQVDAMGNAVFDMRFDAQEGLARLALRTYDSVNRVARDMGAEGQTTQYAWDGNRNLTGITDPLNHATTNTFDQLNRLTRIADAAGNTDFTYDPQDRLASVKDPRLLLTTYSYDTIGNLATLSSPDTGSTTLTYDDAGNVVTRTDARNVVTTYSYDALNRATAATVTDGTVTYEYDNVATGGSYARGHLTKVTDPSGNTTFAYDARGRVTSKVQSVNGASGTKTFTIGYGYTSGRQSSITYPSGRTVTYGFDIQGQITSLSVSGTAVLASAEYEPFGPARKWTWANAEVMERTFDQDGRVKTLTLGPNVSTYADLLQVFGYDAMNRLTNAFLAAGQSQSFTYDANGNRTNATVNAQSTTYTYPSGSHRLTSLSGAVTRSFTYDNAGDVITTGGITFTYDGRARLKQAGTTTFAVNGLGQRVRKAGAAETYFAYDEAGHLIGEYDSTGAPVTETVWLGDTPVAVLKTSGAGFDVYYVWSDRLNTPRLITDAANQSRWEWPHNDPFGNNLPNENPSGQGQFAYNLRFPGQYYDAETGTHYNYFRDYDPSIGRYIESDPIGLIGGPNTFAYAGSRPLINSDRLGLLFGIDAGEGFGLDAAEHWAARRASSGNWLYAIPGTLSTMWTPCRSNDTFIDLLLAPAAGARALPWATKLLPNSIKGLIGESASAAKNLLEGNRLLDMQRQIPGFSTIADSAWQSASGAVYYVESKFGTAGLTKAQRIARDALGATYQVEKWTYDWVGRVGTYLGAGVGAATADCQCSTAR